MMSSQSWNHTTFVGSEMDFSCSFVMLLVIDRKKENVLMLRTRSFNYTSSIYTTLGPGTKCRLA